MSVGKPGRLLIFLPMLLLLSACADEHTAEPAGTPVPVQATRPVQQETAGRWQPAPGLTWQWQLEGEIDLSIEADVYDLDLYIDQPVIDALHARGRRVICYISVGSWEEWRPDADQFPAALLGKKYTGWQGERWLDIRRIDLLAPIMRARFDLCAQKGFDGLEPDNMDLYAEDTGFALTYQDQLAYALWLAEEAHARGLAIGVKNAPEQVQDLVDHFDFVISEDAFFYDWADQLQPFIAAGKPVFAAEYTDTRVDFAAACDWGRQHGFAFILKHRDLDAWLRTCPP